jgi:hypothetical protein
MEMKAFVRPLITSAGRSAAILSLFALVAATSACRVEPAASEEAAMQRLESIPYLNWLGVSESARYLDGVTAHQPELTASGVNFFNSRPRARAVFMDLDGSEVHAWRGSSRDGWHHIELDSDGSLYAIEKDVALSKLDWHSNLLWKREIGAHHDIALLPEGVLVLTRGPAELTVRGHRLRILDDYIELLSSEGERVRRIPVSRLFGERLSDETIAEIELILKETPLAVPEPETALDVFHTNAIEMLADGRLLVGVRNLDLVAIVDLESESVVWEWGPGELDRPHEPTMLANGHLLIFDNGMHRGYSRVVEVDTATSQIVWEYSEGPGGDFYTRIRGGVQQLPNGNVLVTESDRGRVFEVTREKQIVWEYYNPDRISAEPIPNDVRAFRAPIYRVKRISLEVMAAIAER